MRTAQIVSHRYGIGIMVRFSRAIPLRNAVPGPYEVLAQLPEREGEIQYRIKSDSNGASMADDVHSVDIAHIAEQAALELLSALP